MTPDLANLSRLMEVSRGRPEITIALIDGPVNVDLPCFVSSRMRNTKRVVTGLGVQAGTQSAAGEHGTLVAGILTGSRGWTPALCPGCTVLLHPIFREHKTDVDGTPVASTADLAEAIVETVDQGARIINLSCGAWQCSAKDERQLESACGYAMRKQVLVFAAAGNQGSVGGSCTTKHAWVVPVMSLDEASHPANESNLSASIGQRGLGAPGRNIVSVGMSGRLTAFSGTSAACAFASGAAALLWSEFAGLPPWEIKAAMIPERRARSIVPPTLDAWRAYQTLTFRSKNRSLA